MKMIRRSKKSFCIVIFCVFSITYTISSFVAKYARNELRPPMLWYKVKDYFVEDDTSCYYDTERDFLISVTEKLSLYNAIFFHVTSCDEPIRLREACAVEAAAKLHSNRHVIVLFTRSLTEDQCYEGLLGEIYKLPNVDFARIPIATYALGTPLAKMFRNDIEKVGKRRYRRVAEFLKFVTLSRFGGMVVDTDMMVAASVNYLGYNWAVKQDDKSLGSAIITIAKEKLAKTLMPLFMEALLSQANDEDIDGGRAMFEVLLKFCNATSVKEMTPTRCDGFQIYSNEFFYPVNRSASRAYFRPGSLEDFDELTFGYHIWNSENARQSVPVRSLYSKIAQKYCPNIFRKFSNSFVEFL